MRLAEKLDWKGLRGCLFIYPSHLKFSISKYIDITAAAAAANVR
jgi:hypothetical protein